MRTICVKSYNESIQRRYRICHIIVSYMRSIQYEYLTLSNRIISNYNISIDPSNLLQLVTSIAIPSDWKNNFLTNSSPDGPWQPPWKTAIYLTPPDSVQIMCDSCQRVHLPRIYDNAWCLASWDSLHITFITGTTHTSNQPHQSNFYTYGFSVVVDNRFSVTMLHSKQDFLGGLKKGLCVINGFEDPKCTQFMRAPSLGSLMTILVILVGYK